MAAILAIAGIVMMTYADGFHSHSVIGIALVVGSASVSALYKVDAGSRPSGPSWEGRAGLGVAGPLLWGRLGLKASCCFPGAPGHEASW